MRKLLTILTLLLAVAMQGYAATDVDLSKFSKMDEGSTYTSGESGYTFTGEQYKGIQWWIGNESSYSADKIVIKTNSAATLRLSVAYVKVDGEESEPESTFNPLTLSNGTTYEYVQELNAQYANRKIQKIQIYNDGTESVTFTQILLIEKSSPVLDWYHEYETGNSAFSNLAAGDKVSVTFTSEGELSTGDFQIWYKDASNGWAGTQVTNGTLTDKVYEFVVDATSADQIKANGLFIKGQNAAVGSVERITKTSQTLKAVSGKVMLGESYYTMVTISKGTFANVSEGDVITVNMSDVVSSGASITMKYNGEDSANKEWGQITSEYNNSLTSEQTKFEYTLTSDNATKLKKQGLCITGTGFTCGNIEILTFGEITADTNGNPTEKRKLTITQPTAGGAIRIGDSESAPAADTYHDINSTVTLKAVASEGYKLAKWTKDGSDLDETGTSLQVTMSADVIVTAVFGQIFSVTATSAEEGKGTVEIADAAEDNKYAQGTTVKVTATPKNGYAFDKWTKTENPSWSSTTNPLSIEDLNANWTLTATFKDATFTAPVGETLLSSTIQAMESGWTKNIHIETYNTYKAGDVVKVYVKSVSSGQISLKSATDGWPGLSTELENGVNLDTDATVYSYTLTADNAIKLNSGGLIITGQGYTAWGVTIIPLPTEVKELSTGSMKINGSNGLVIHKEMFAKVVAGDVITINVSNVQSGAKYSLSSAGEANDNTYDWKWIKDEDLASDATSISYTLEESHLTNIKAAGLQIAGNSVGGFTCGDVTITTAYDVPEAQTHSNPTYTLTVTEPVGGTITIKKGSETVSAGSFELDTELTLTASASDGYIFSKWTKDGADAGTNATLSLTMTANVTVAAVFKGNALKTEERRTLWTSAEGEVLSWSDMMAQAEEVGEIVEAGEILIVTVKSVDTSADHYPQIQLRDKDDHKIGEINPLVAGENKLKITAEMATKMAGGFKFQGESATLTKLELYKPTPITKLAEEETKTLYSNTEGGVLDDWNTITIERNSEWGAVLEEDERIIISVKAKDANCEWPTVALSNSDGSIGSTANLLNDLTMPAELTVALTAEMISKMKNGFNITGDGATITKAVLYKPTMPAKKTYTLNSTETAISGDANVTVAAEKFANISAYDVLTVNFTITTSPANVILKGNGEDGGWDYLKEMKFENGETLFALPLTPAMTSNLKKNGLQITGSGYTFKSVTLKTAGEVAEDQTETEPVFDSTGEADLTEMKGQDDKTTVTYNSDESITITTTEDYKAAQIWFNEPEKATGNVLKVEISESGVNVTVTVQYTDGSQSQMSSTATASARARTRATAGTTISVPLETGKEVQNIEVKNAKAGTITILKMQQVTQNVFTDGKADLTMVKPQSNATYDVSTHTLATTQGWTGATVTPISSENVSGEELLIRFSAAAQVKVAVKYRTDVEGPSTIMEAPATSVRLTLDKTKNIQEIMIQPTTASILTFSEIAVNSSATKDNVDQIFTNGKADLSKFVSQDEGKVIYDKENHIIRATEGWTGVELNLGEGQEVSGKELKIRFESEAKVKVSVTYTDGSNATYIMEDADDVLRMEISGSKKIRKIEIQPTEASNVKLLEVAVNAEPEDISLKQGETRDLWKSGSGETLNWNETARQKKSVGELLQEFDEILVTVTGVDAGNDWPKLFLRDAQSNQVGKEVLLNGVTTFPYVVRIPLNSVMAEQVQKGFCICGDGVTVSQLQVYRPYAPKKGDIHLKALDYGYGSSYDAAAYTITTTTRWAARGWEIGDMRYNSKDLVIIGFEAVDFPVTIKMEYVDADGEKQASSTGVAAGNTSVQMAIPDGIRQLDRVYLIFQNPGSLTMTEATVVTHSEARTRGFINDGIGGMTGIESVTPARSDGEGEWYDLSGRRVEKPAKGVYVRGGKKVIIK